MGWTAEVGWTAELGWIASRGVRNSTARIQIFRSCWSYFTVEGGGRDRAGEADPDNGKQTGAKASVRRAESGIVLGFTPHRTAPGAPAAAPGPDFISILFTMYELTIRITIRINKLIAKKSFTTMHYLSRNYGPKCIFLHSIYLSAVRVVRGRVGVRKLCQMSERLDRRSVVVRWSMVGQVVCRLTRWSVGFSGGL